MHMYRHVRASPANVQIVPIKSYGHEKGVLDHFWYYSCEGPEVQYRQTTPVGTYGT
jgi:hypothetical protein